MQCRAKAKSTQVQCTRRAMPNGLCYVHGGPSLSGKENPAYKHGRYSKSIPARMAATYDRGRQDRKLLDMREDVALLDARIADLLSRVDTGEAGRIWDLALKAYTEMQAAMRENDTVKGAEANAALGRLLRKGREDYHAWDEVGKSLEQKRKTVESEQKRQAQEKLLVPITELGLVVQSLAASVSTHVTDLGVLRSINQDWHRLLGRNPQPGDYWAPRDTAEPDGATENPRLP